MNQRKDVIEFTRGFMDRIRDRCREMEPEAWAEMDALPEIRGRQAKNGERLVYLKHKDGSIESLKYPRKKK